MLGYVSTPDPNRYTADKWEGQIVAFNGSDRTAKVLRAYWQGPGKAVQLRVSENGSERDSKDGILAEDSETPESQPFLTDSEHVTIVRS